MKYILVLIIAFLFVGCVHQQPKKVYLLKKFNQEEAKRLMKKGNNTIKGSALIRQNGGGIVTCAGNEVTLIPYTEYAAERMQHINLASREGYSPLDLSFSPHASFFDSLTKKTICDVQGYFKFKDVSDGTFFVITTIIWQVGSRQGGMLTQRIDVEDGEIKEIVLVP